MTNWHWTKPNLIESISCKSIKIHVECTEFQTDIKKKILEATRNSRRKKKLYLNTEDRYTFPHLSGNVSKANAFTNC